MNRIAIVTALAMAGNVHLCAADVARAGRPSGNYATVVKNKSRGSSMYCVKGESGKTLHGSEYGR